MRARMIGAALMCVAVISAAGCSSTMTSTEKSLEYAKEAVLRDEILRKVLVPCIIESEGLTSVSDAQRDRIIGFILATPELSERLENIPRALFEMNEEERELYYEGFYTDCIHTSLEIEEMHRQEWQRALDEMRE